MSDWANTQHIEVVEVEVFAEPEIVIPDVSSAEYRRMPVGDQQLVVQAHVESLHLGDHCPSPARNATLFPRIEEPHLDIGVGLEVSHECLLTNRQEIIDHQAYSHATLGCVHSPLQQ